MKMNSTILIVALCTITACGGSGGGYVPEDPTRGITGSPDPSRNDTAWFSGHLEMQTEGTQNSQRLTGKSFYEPIQFRVNFNRNSFHFVRGLSNSNGATISINGNFTDEGVVSGSSSVRLRGVAGYPYSGSINGRINDNEIGVKFRGAGGHYESACFVGCPVSYFSGSYTGGFVANAD